MRVLVGGLAVALLLGLGGCRGPAGHPAAAPTHPGASPSWVTTYTTGDVGSGVGGGGGGGTGKFTLSGVPARLSYSVSMTGTSGEVVISVAPWHFTVGQPPPDCGSGPSGDPGPAVIAVIPGSGSAQVAIEKAQGTYALCTSAQSANQFTFSVSESVQQLQ